MNTDRWQRIKEIFIATVQRDPEERRVFLKAACREDLDLQKKVESLLLAHEESEDFLELPTGMRGCSWRRSSCLWNASDSTFLRASSPRAAWARCTRRCRNTRSAPWPSR